MSFVITDKRLTNQHLLGQKFANPEQVVAHLGAVQSQDYAAAKWAVGLRCANATDQVIEEAYNQGKILRTHVMRPTWHFVTPENIKWMQELTGQRVLTQNKSMLKKLELDVTILSRCHDILCERLQGNNFATRDELAQALEQQGIAARGQRLAYIVMQAEVTALICSGPRRGKQFTYALLEERAPNAKTLSREEALAKLTKTYFTSHGPAQLKDFSWWSGLPIKDVQLGLELVGKELQCEVVNGKTYWFGEMRTLVKKNLSEVFLLSIYDEYTIAYKDRTDISHKNDIERMLSMGAALTAVIVIDGKVVGTWKRVLGKKDVTLTARFFGPITPEQEEATKLAAKKYAQFLGLADAVVVRFVTSKR